MSGATETALRLARALWRAAPRPVRDALGLRIGAALRDHMAAGIRAPPWAPASPSSMVVSAFYAGFTGVAAAGRATADALERAGLEVIRHDLGALLDAGGFQDHDLPGDPQGVWLVHANPPEAKLVLARLRRTGWERRFRIGYWAWELPKAPADWLRTAGAFHAVWAPSAFVRDSLADAAAPVVLRPHPPPQVGEARPDRPSFGLPAEAVIVLAMADLASGYRRKNPLGAVHAFRRAFPLPRPDRLLVVKLHSAGAKPEALASLREAVAGRADIRLIDEKVPHGRVLDLIASVDVLLSLHRSEGFGLPIAEALSLGRAVLATGWSGSQDLLGAIPGACVPYRLTPVEDPGGPYDDPSQSWAEPDLDAAAARIAALSADASERRAVAAAGRAVLDRMALSWSRAALRAEPWAAGVSDRD